jgi:hypothetical protein
MTHYSLAEAQKGNMLRAISGDLGARRRGSGGKVAYFRPDPGIVSWASADDKVGKADNDCEGGRRGIVNALGFYRVR